MKPNNDYKNYSLSNNLLGLLKQSVWLFEQLTHMTSCNASAFYELCMMSSYCDLAPNHVTSRCHHDHQQGI